MNPVPNIKRAMLKALLAVDGLPFPQAAVDDAVRQLVVPKPLQSDVEQARRELESDGFIQGSRDDLDPGLVTWTLTEKGKHRAKQL